MFRKVIALIALLASTPAAATDVARAPIPCERACMEQLADDILSAMAARDSSTLPLAKGAKYTEIGQDMGFANGLWRTASSVGAYRHVLADPASGQFGVFATLDEQGHGVTLAMRVRLELGLISEVEVVTYRVGAGPAWNDAGFAVLEEMEVPEEVWTMPAPPAERLSRQELVLAASHYFNAIENNDGRGYYPFTDDCHRLENGAATTNTPGIVRMGPVDIGGMGCKEQFETGLYGVVTEVHDRRFLVVDEERQAVFASAVFDHCGCKPSLTMPDGTVVDTCFFNKPSSILLLEAFKIDKGLIRRVEAVGTSVPYHSDPGW